MTPRASGPTEAPEALVAAGEAAEARGDFVSAEAAYATLSDRSDPAVAADGHFRLGVLAWRQSRFEQALAEFARTRELARVANRADLEARAHNGDGNVYCQRGEYGQARASYRVAMETAQDPILRGRSLQNLGVLANIEGDLETALQHYGRARKVFHDHGDRGGEALVLHNMGMLYADRREWDEADDSYRQALALFEEAGNQAMIATVLANRSEVLSARGLLVEAVRHCRLAIAIYSETGDEMGRDEALRWQGHALRRMGEFAEAERNLVEAVHGAVRHRIKLLEAEAAREMALLKTDVGQAAEAATWRARALALFRGLGAARDVAELE